MNDFDTLVADAGLTAEQGTTLLGWAQANYPAEHAHNVAMHELHHIIAAKSNGVEYDNPAIRDQLGLGQI